MRHHVPNVVGRSPQILGGGTCVDIQSQRETKEGSPEGAAQDVRWLGGPGLTSASSTRRPSTRCYFLACFFAAQYAFIRAACFFLWAAVNTLVVFFAGWGAVAPAPFRNAFLGGRQPSFGGSG